MRKLLKKIWNYLFVADSKSFTAGQKIPNWKINLTKTKRK